MLVRWRRLGGRVAVELELRGGTGPENDEEIQKMRQEIQQSITRGKKKSQVVV